MTDYANEAARYHSASAARTRQAAEVARRVFTDGDLILLALPRDVAQALLNELQTALKETP